MQPPLLSLAATHSHQLQMILSKWKTGDFQEDFVEMMREVEESQTLGPKGFQICGPCPYIQKAGVPGLPGPLGVNVEG